MAVSDLPGAPIWVELYTSDPQAAAGFYGRLFGWTTQDAGADDGGYLTFLLDGAPVAGCLLNDGTTGGVNAWSVYLESDDAEATVRMAEANGGTAGVEPIQVGDLGRMAFVEDPGGAMVGVWEPGGHEGFATRGEVGTPAWFELFTGDFPAVIVFYTNAFGWTVHPVSDTDEFRYSTLGKDDDARAGVMDASGFLDGARSAWTVYWSVADTDESVRLAEDAGASVVRAAEDSPYGRVAELADPQGARFRLLGPSAPAPG